MCGSHNPRYRSPYLEIGTKIDFNSQSANYCEEESSWLLLAMS